MKWARFYLLEMADFTNQFLGPFRIFWRGHSRRGLVVRPAAYTASTFIAVLSYYTHFTAKYTQKTHFALNMYKNGTNSRANGSSGA